MKRIWLVLVLLTVVPRAHAQTAGKLVAAPDIIPPATKEMQHPEFWVSRIAQPDRVILTPEQIDRFNRKNRTRSLVRKNVHGDTVVIDSVLANGNFSGVSFHLSDPLLLRNSSGVKLSAQLSNARDYLLSTDLWDRRQIPFSAAEKHELIEEMNPDRVPRSVRPRHGLVVRHTLNRFIPTHRSAYGAQYQWLDMFQTATLETGMPVAVLHSSRSGEWLYVKSNYSTGWIPAANVATGSTDRIREISDPHDFVVAITPVVPVYADPEGDNWITSILLGERLQLDEKTGSALRVTVPVRNPDGTLGTASGWIRDREGVSEGYQPYTQRNVITTFFRLLNRPYGWGGTEHEYDCVGAVRAVYLTFGIFMPRWTTYELYHTDHVTAFPADTPVEEKYRFLDACEPGITVCGFDWHVVLYLGKVDGTHFIIHQNGYSYHDAAGTEYRVGRVSVNHTELEGGADIRRWTEMSVFK